MSVHDDLEFPKEVSFVILMVGKDVEVRRQLLNN
jgi:hypothetical protein